MKIDVTLHRSNDCEEEPQKLQLNELSWKWKVTKERKQLKYCEIAYYQKTAVRMKPSQRKLREVPMQIGYVGYII